MSAAALATTVNASRFSPAQWRDAIQSAANEIAKYALSFDGATVGESLTAEATAGMVGAHIPMVGKESFELSLVGTREACQSLSGAVLMMGIDAKLPPADIADAIGEIANQLAGGVKRRIAGTSGDLELGLPVFVNGSVEPTKHQSVMVIPIKFGPIDAMVVIVGPK